MTRKDILDNALKCVNGDREQDYGSPENSFKTIADLWTVYVNATPGEEMIFTPKDVAVMLSLLKIARIANGHAKADNWIDLAGYAACGGEIELPGDLVEIGYDKESPDGTEPPVLWADNFKYKSITTINSSETAGSTLGAYNYKETKDI